MAEQIHVMLVDDMAESRAMLKKQLLAGDFDIVGEAGFGPEAIDLARELRPNVILIGVEEPTARPLRTLEMLALAMRDCPIVAISSLSDRESLRRAMLAGARDYLVKPLLAEDLRQALVDLIENERRRFAVAEEVIEGGHRGEIITVFGAKGGIGRTMLATNLAVALVKEANQRVALVDLDTHLGDVALLLDIVPERTLADVVPVVDRLDPELMRSFLTVHRSGVRVLAAPLRPEAGETIQPVVVQKVLEVLRKTYDYVVVDTPRAFNDNVITAMDLSTLILLVTTLEIPCLKSTKLCLDMLRSWRYPTEKVKLVINHAHQANGVGSRDVEGILEYPIFWKIPNDKVVGLATRLGEPFLLGKPGAKISRNLANLSYVLSGVRAPRSGWLGRIIGRG